MAIKKQESYDPTCHLPFYTFVFGNRVELVYARRQSTVGLIDRRVVIGHTQRATRNNFVHHDALGVQANGTDTQ